MHNSLMGLIALMSVSVAVPPVLAESADSQAAVEAPVTTKSDTSFPTLHLKDQHDTPVNLPGDASVIVYTDTKEVDEWADPVMAAFGQQLMNAEHVVYLSDIHRMPWLISKMIAMPALRERKYSVALIREAPESPVLSKPENGCLDWIQLQSGTVVSRTPVCTPAVLKTRLDALSSAK